MTTVVIAGLIAFLGLGAWWTWGRHHPLDGAVARPLVGEEGRYPADRLAIANLGGAPENYERINDLAGVRSLKMLTESELAAYESAGAEQAKVDVSRLGAGKATVLLVRTRDSVSARSAVRTLTDLQLSFGFRMAEGHGTVVSTKLSAKPDVLPGGRAHYAHGDIVARVELRGENQQQVHEQFDQVLRRQLEALPADD